MQLLLCTTRHKQRTGETRCSHTYRVNECCMKSLSHSAQNKRSLHHQEFIVAAFASVSSWALGALEIPRATTLIHVNSRANQLRKHIHTHHSHYKETNNPVYERGVAVSESAWAVYLWIDRVHGQHLAQRGMNSAGPHSPRDGWLESCE